MRVVVLVVVVTWENKVDSYSDQLKLGQVCKLGVEFDKMLGLEFLGSVHSSIVYFVFFFLWGHKCITNVHLNDEK